jgi:hypothetical protein
LKLKVDRQPPPKEKTPDEVTRDTAVQLAETRKMQAAEARATAADHQLAFTAEEVLHAAAEAYYEGRIDDDEYLDAQRQTLQSLESVDSDDLRHAVYARIERADLAPEALEDHVYDLQSRYAQSELDRIDREAAQVQKQIEADGRMMSAVIETEAIALSHLPEQVQAIAGSLIEARAAEIAEQDPAEAQLQIRYAIECARTMANRINAAETNTAMVKAWDGPLRPGYETYGSRRDRREYDSFGLGFGDDAVQWSDADGAEAKRRATLGVEHDRQRARKQVQGTRTGAEVARDQRAMLTRALQATGKLH